MRIHIYIFGVHQAGEIKSICGIWGDGYDNTGNKELFGKAPFPNVSVSLRVLFFRKNPFIAARVLSFRRHRYAVPAAELVRRTL